MRSKILYIGLFFALLCMGFRSAPKHHERCEDTLDAEVIVIDGESLDKYTDGYIKDSDLIFIIKNIDAIPKDNCINLPITIQENN